jgi:hypothetical protein
MMSRVARWISGERVAVPFCSCTGVAFAPPENVASVMKDTTHPNELDSFRECLIPSASVCMPQAQGAMASAIR